LFFRLLGFFLCRRHVLVLDPFSTEHAALLFKRREVVAGLWRNGHGTSRTAVVARWRFSALLILNSLPLSLVLTLAFLGKLEFTLKLFDAAALGRLSGRFGSSSRSLASLILAEELTVETSIAGFFPVLPFLFKSLLGFFLFSNSALFLCFPLTLLCVPPLLLFFHFTTFLLPHTGRFLCPASLFLGLGLSLLLFDLSLVNTFSLLSLSFLLTDSLFLLAPALLFLGKTGYSGRR
jgi:hypothetical protein